MDAHSDEMHQDNMQEIYQFHSKAQFMGGHEIKTDQQQFISTFHASHVKLNFLTQSFALCSYTANLNTITLEPKMIVYGMQVLLTETHLAIVMEYASGGELFDRISNAGRFSEDEVTVSSQIY